MKKVLLTVFLWLAILPFAYAEDLELKIPSNLTENKDKLSYAYQAQEALRLLHNQKGKDHRDGKITEQEWETWLDGFFKDRSYALLVIIEREKSLLKKENSYTFDLENDFEKISN